jgi:hypothetical protein
VTDITCMVPSAGPLLATSRRAIPAAVARVVTAVGMAWEGRIYGRDTFPAYRPSLVKMWGAQGSFLIALHAKRRFGPYLLVSLYQPHSQSKQPRAYAQGRHYTVVHIRSTENTTRSCQQRCETPNTVSGTNSITVNDAMVLVQTLCVQWHGTRAPPLGSKAHSCVNIVNTSLPTKINCRCDTGCVNVVTCQTHSSLLSTKGPASLETSLVSRLGGKIRLALSRITQQTHEVAFRRYRIALQSQIRESFFVF